METQTIERFFLLNLLRITLSGTGIILITDLIYAQDVLSIIIDAVIFSACLFAFVVRRWSYKASVLVITGSSLVAMLYQWSHGVNLTTSMAVILLIGFIFSMLLKRSLMLGAHIVTGLSILFVVYIQAFVTRTMPPTVGEIATVVVTYLVLYIMIAYCTAVLKIRYDNLTQELRLANESLAAKAQEIAAQNDELLQSNEYINDLNRNLEKIVAERTVQIQTQHQQLIKYTFANAHSLRGPVARLLGLINLRKLEDQPDNTFFFTKMEDQAKEIDRVVKDINAELER